jgi:hypothetical protein
MCQMCIPLLASVTRSAREVEDASDEEREHVKQVAGNSQPIPSRVTSVVERAMALVMRPSGTDPIDLSGR